MFFCFHPPLSVPMPCRSCWANTICECLRVRSSSWRPKTSSGTPSEWKNEKSCLRILLPFAPFHSQSQTHFIFLSVCRYDYQTLDFDMMLIKLFHPVEVTDRVAPIPLPSGCPYAGLPCSVSGWGNTMQGGEGGLMRVIWISNVLNDIMWRIYSVKCDFSLFKIKIRFKDLLIPWEEIHVTATQRQAER